MSIDTFRDASVRPLVLLIDFADRPSTASPSISDNSAFAARYFGAGPSDLSVKNYWEENSYTRQGTNLPGRSFQVLGSGADIVGWLRAGTDADPLTEDFPTTIVSSSQIADVQVSNVRQLLADAIDYLDSRGFDFSPYVRASDNTFQAVILHHPGYGQEDTGAAEDPYSHTAQIAAINPSNQPAFSIVDYTIVPSLQAPFNPADRDPAVDPLIGIGVVVHEMGHLFGLPDLYPTGTQGQVGGSFSGVGVFDLMGYGLWGSNFLDRPDTPAHLSAWSKAFLGWLIPLEVNVNSPRTLRPVEQFPEADMVLSNTAADPEQYFLVENRQTSGPWLFDKFLTAPTGAGAGALIWQIDNVVIRNHIGSNTVNSNPEFRGVYLKEADDVFDLAEPFSGSTANDLARFFGLREDYFFAPAQIFDRDNPGATVNSRPIVDTTFTNHPVDFGARVSMTDFTITPGANDLEYIVSVSGGWKTFNTTSTQASYPTPMRSDDILSIAFDSGNAVWMGSSDQGIFRFLGTDFEILGRQRDLPGPGGTAPPGATVARIQGMAFEGKTGSMWVGTDRGLYKMRDSGSGFRVLDSSTSGSLGIGGNRIPSTFDPGANDVRKIVVRGGFLEGSREIDIKYAATPVGLLRIDDLNNDLSDDDIVETILRGDVTAVVVDDNGTPEAALDDVVWVGMGNGDLFRSLKPAEPGGANNADPRVDSHFKRMFTLAGTPKITALAVDDSSRLWIGTETRGIQVFILLEPGGENVRDPFDFDADGDDLEGTSPPFLDRTRGLASNNVTGITFQVISLAEPVTWISHIRETVSPFTDGGVSRFNANAANDNTSSIDRRVSVFLPEAGVLPEDQVNGPSSNWVSTAAADSAGNVWFGTTEQDPQGASRFGSAGILSLDKSNYVNESAIAVVTLQNDGLNTLSGEVETANVKVSSSSDPTGITVILTETGPNTGVFQGQFGFSKGASDEVSFLIRISHNDTVTVSPIGFQASPATATWRDVFPFEDSLLIEGGACFIATAAYGSILAPEVRLLRAFRDEYLLTNGSGRTLVALYYHVSPPIASFLSERPWTRFAARALLVPVVRAASFSMGTGPAEKGTVLFILLLMFRITAVLSKGGRGNRSRDRDAAG